MRLLYRRNILLILLIFLAGPTLWSQKYPDLALDQGMPRFPLYQIKADLGTAIVNRLGAEIECIPWERWGFSFRYGFQGSFSNLREWGRQQCVLGAGQGLAFGVRYHLRGPVPWRGWSIRATGFVDWRDESEWACQGLSGALRSGREYGLNGTLHYQLPVGHGGFFLEPYLGFGGRLKSLEVHGASIRTEQGLDWQVPLGLMIGFGI